MFSPTGRDSRKAYMRSSLDHLLKPQNDMDMFPSFGTFSMNVLARSEKNLFQFFLNVSQFDPEDIDVRIIDDFIVVHGKHDEKTDEHGYVTREFTRRIRIPKDVDSHNISSVYNRNGVLVIKGQRKVIQPDSNNVRTIPIEIQKPLDIGAREKVVNVQRVASVADGSQQADVQQASVGTATTE